MSIISFLREILSTEGVQKGTIKYNYTRQDSDLSDELCSKDMQIGDYYSVGGNGRNWDDVNFKELRKEVFEKENIGWLDRATYRLKNILRSQDSRVDTLRKDLQEMYKLSEVEKVKRYSEIYKEYLMEIALLDESDIKAEQELVELIPDLRATNRLSAAKNTILLGESVGSVNRRSRLVQKNAMGILTTQDAFGAIPTREDAVALQCFTFRNMNEQGINESLGELRATEKRYQELKKLADNGELPDSMKGEYEFLKLAHTQYTTTGYAGAYAGIGTNSFISQESADYYAGLVANDTNYFGISNEVLDLVRKFAETHPEEFAGIGTENFQAFMDRVTGGAYTARAYAASGVHPSTVAGNGVVSGAIAAAQQMLASTPQTTETTENSTASAMSSSKDGKERSDNKTDKAYKTDKTLKTEKTVSNPINQKTNNSGITSSVLNPAEEVPQSIAACKTVADIERYIETSKISKREACIQIFEDNNLSRYKEQYGIKLFMLIGDDMKDITFNELSGRGKVAVASAMNLESLEKLDTKDSSYYVKMYVTNLKKEKAKLRGENNV